MLNYMSAQSILALQLLSLYNRIADPLPASQQTIYYLAIVANSISSCFRDGALRVLGHEFDQ